MFKKRLMTFLIGAPVVIGAVLTIPPLAFGIALLVLFMFASWEWSRLMGITMLYSRIAYVLLIGAVISVLYLWVNSTFWLMGIALFCWLLVLMAVIMYPKGIDIWSNKSNLSLLGIIILAASWLALVLLRQYEQGIGLVLYLLILVWSTDSGAYIIGKVFGKHKLCPQLSPGKTIEGAIGGIILAGIISVIGGFVFEVIGWQWLLWLTLALLTSVLSMFGDLLISMLKRQQGLKDTGHLLPGHGGILDRIDSLLSAAPFFTFFYTLILIKSS